MALRWRTLQTAHFEIHYHEPLGLVARRVGAVAERAHTRLAPLLGHEPRERTQVVLSDNSDSANGSAAALPYNTIRLFATGPEDLTALADYDDWLTELVVHEHTHILHLDTIGGIPAIINSIFGKLYPPNSVQPRWFLEGVAVHEESEHTSGGRLRSTLFDMHLRMDALEDRLLSLDQLSNTADRWPHGNSWYLYGSRFVEFIVRHHGWEALKVMSHEYGSELIPYGLNRVARRATGRSFVELYRAFQDETRRRYRSVARSIRAAGLREGRRITHHGERTQTPRFLNANRVVYWASDGRSRGQLRLLDAETGGNVETLTWVAGQGAAAPTPGGREVVFSALGPHRDLYFFNDLFRHDRRSGSTTRLTEGLRSREPDVSPDGRRVAFTVNGAATTHLAVADLSRVDATRRIVVRNRRHEQVYTPRWHPNGRLIAYSAWEKGGYRDIKVVDVETGESRYITRDRALDTGPQWSPDGSWLYFSSDRSGVANIYAYHVANKKVFQVTNVLGGAFQPTLSPDGTRMVYVGYTSRGFDLWTMRLTPARFPAARDTAEDRPEAVRSDEHLVGLSEEYSPASTIAPRAWELDIGEDGFGTQLAVLFSGGDVLGYHAYSGRVGASLKRGTTTADVSWSLNRTPVPIRLRAFRNEAPRGGLIVAGERRTWVQETIGGEIGLSYPFPSFFHAERISLTYSLLHTRAAGPFGGRLDPNDPAPTLPGTGFVGSVRTGWSWSDALRTTYDVSPSEGRSVAVNLSLSHPLLGSEFETVTASWALEQYLENPWVEHHVLALRYGGGLGGGDAGQRGVFAVGGFPDASLLDAVLDNVILGGVALRGYAPFSRRGSQFHLLQSEYRFLVFRPQYGVDTLPAYLNRIWALVFLDFGDAFFGEPDLSTFRFGTGVELLTDFTLGYYLPLTFRLGLARGLSEGGITQYYGNIGIPF